MAAANEFLNHVLEMLAPLGAVRARRMFGGYGLYCSDLFFGIVASDVLYLKTDDSNRADFVRAGSEPFRYSRLSGRTTLNFHRAPDEALESPQLMAPWARGALACALRARAERLSGQPRQRPGATAPPGRPRHRRKGR
jgi:DNA transformation protein